MEAFLLVLIFAFDGQSELMAAKFPSMKECEAERRTVIERFVGPKKSYPDVASVVAVCGKQIKGVAI